MAEKYIDMQRKVFTTDFKKFCRKNFRKSMEELEKVRKFYLSGAGLLILLGIFLIAAAIIFLNSGVSSLKNIDSIFNIVGIIATLCFMGSSFIVKKYKMRAKEIILNKLLSYIGNFHTVKEKESVLDYVRKLKLFDSFNTNNFDDRIQGTYNNLAVDICEMDLAYVTSSGKRTRRITIFKGILITVESNKKFEGFTVIKRNLANLGLRQYKGADKVNLEDVEFEKLYDVYSTGQIEARYLLTPAFMNRMVKLEKRGIVPNITMSFEMGNVNIAVSSSKDWFEIPILKPATKLENYRAIVLELITLLKVIDSLKLDQNIGM